MISWIQKTFQQHFRVIFGILLAGLIVSFIFTIGAAPGLGRADQKILSRPFFGLNLSSQADQQKIFGDANLSILLQAGYAALEGAQLQEYALHRQASLAFADKLSVPAPTPDEIADYVKGLRGFAGANGQFDPKRYSDFRDSLKGDSRLKESDVSRILSDNIRADRAQALLGGPGYVLPSDVKSQLIRAESTWTIAVATVDFASFNPTITPTDVNLTKFFEDNGSRYELPPRVSVSYANFPATSYVANVTVTEPEVKAYYDANPARFPKPEQKPIVKPDDKAPKVTVPTPPSDPALDYALVRPQVETALRLEKAARLAAKDASDFTLALYDKKVKPASTELTDMLASRKIALKDVPPFAHDAPPAEFSTNPEIAEEAFKLSKDRFFSDAIATANGSVVLFWKENLPSRQPSLIEVREKVTADYIDSEKHKRFDELGKDLRTQLVAKIKAGTPLEKAAPEVAAAANVKIEAKAYPAFTLRQRPQDLDYSVLGALETLNKGDLSEMIMAQDKGRFVYATDKKTPDLSESNPLYVSTRDQIAQYTARQNGNEYLRELVERELAKTAPATP